MGMKGEGDRASGQAESPASMLPLQVASLVLASTS